MVGVTDVREHEVDKSKNKEKERKSWSGKKKVNSWKNFSFMDYTCRYIYVYVGLAKNDREMFTSLPLYLQHGYWFSDGEFIATDGGFEGSSFSFFLILLFNIPLSFAPVEMICLILLCLAATLKAKSVISAQS